MDRTIYKICPRPLWRAAGSSASFKGAAIDLADGYIHFSTAAQVVETAARHFAGQSDLLLIAVDTAMLGDDLRYEVSRGDDLFPHLHADLDLKAVLWVKPLPFEDGAFVFPELEA